MVLLLVVLLIWSGHGVRFQLGMLGDIGNSVRFVREHWFPIDTSDAAFAIKQMVITLQIALFSTLVALLIALPVSFMAARNTSPLRSVYHGFRFMFNFLRSVPELVLALIFIPTLGLGPMPAVLALIIHNIGVFGKMISEMIEAMNKGPQEAVASVGGTRSLIALYGIVPQMLPLVLSQYFYRLEVAIRTCLILGIVGAGGLGQLLYNDFKQFFYEKVAFEVLLIMVLVTSVDYLGAWIRKRVNA
ncbi:phosphonate ABC transporter, permease protein PhnE [Paenibacillus chartarius]|uniref:Phosphonate ABC transporter, permease protein PhnE n=1 Tax=Paenibacillus chartarius TaxID=747481 RepID=A0ABV6DI64_9BACL